MTIACRYWFLLMIFLALGDSLVAQQVHIGALKQEPGYIFFNGKATRFASDTPVTLEAVLKPAAQGKFTPIPDKPIVFHGFDPSFYWYRFSLENSDSMDMRVILLFGGKGIRSAELWQGHNGTWLSLGKTGYKYPFQQRPYLFASYGYPIVVPAHATVQYYLDVDESHAYKTINLAVFEPKKMDAVKSRFYYFFGLLIGILLLFALLNIYLYVSVKESIHCWYTLYILFTICFLIKHEGLDMQFLGMDSELAYRASSMVGFVAMGSGFLVHVVQLFLMNINRKSALGIALSLTKWSLWISGFLYFIVFFVEPSNLVEVVIFEWANKTAIAGIVLVIIACLYSISRGYKPAWILLLGQSAYLIGAMFRALFVGDLSMVIPPAPFQVGLLVEVVVISFALMYRYNLFKREKELMGNQLKQQQIMYSEQMMATQENERKRIAEDLHDELGGNLAAIKMAVQRIQMTDEERDMLKGLVDTTSVTARDIAHNLMPPDFERSSLTDMLTSHYNKLTTETEIRFQFLTSGDLHSFSKQDELMIYRILMELTTNIQKHARATEATVQLMFDGEALEMMVEDNGSGFSEKHPDGIGLKNVRSRVDYLGGTLHIDTGQMGTTIMIRIPYQKAL